MGWLDHLETDDNVDDPIVVTSLEGGRRAMRYVFRAEVRAHASMWESDYGVLSEEHRVLRDDLLRAHHNLCRNPASLITRERFIRADEKFWAEVERRIESNMQELDEEVDDDPRLRGFHEGWVWTFRYTHPDDYPELLDKLQAEYLEEKSQFEASGGNPLLGLSMQRAERIWKETARFIYLAYTDRAALDAMFAPGDAYAAKEGDDDISELDVDFD